MPQQTPWFAFTSHASVAHRFALQTALKDDTMAAWRGHFINEYSEAAMAALQSRWEKRIRQLREAEYRPLKSKMARMRATHCPTTLAFTPEPRAPCKSYLLCPYCWCRRVVQENFDRLLRSIYPSPNARIPNDYALVSVVTTRNLKSDYSAEEIVQLVQRERPAFEPLMINTHGYSLTSVIDPSYEGWRLQHRVLGVADYDFRLGYLREWKLPNAQVTVDGYKCPVERETLAQVVGLTCSYPAGMLFAPVWMVKELLLARSGSRGKAPRLSVFRGVVYKNRKARIRRRQ